MIFISKLSFIFCPMPGEPTPLTDGVLFGQSTSLFALVAQGINISAIFFNCQYYLSWYYVIHVTPIYSNVFVNLCSLENPRLCLPLLFAHRRRPQTILVIAK